MFKSVPLFNRFRFLERVDIARAKIFQHSLPGISNPDAVRSGAKFLRKLSKGPGFLDYFDPVRPNLYSHLPKSQQKWEDWERNENTKERKERAFRHGKIPVQKGKGKKATLAKKKK